MIITTIEFALFDKKGEEHTVTVIERETSVTFIFPLEVHGNANAKDKKSPVLNFDIERGIKNLPGFIVDRMHRLSAFNQSFQSILINERKHELDVQYKDKKKVREVIFVNGIELSEGCTVRFTVEDGNKNVLREIAHGYDDVLMMANLEKKLCDILKGADLTVGNIPIKKDDRGFPAYSKKLEINEFLYRSGLFVEEQKSIMVALNNNLDKVLQVAHYCKDNGNDKIYLESISDKRVTHSITDIMQWNTRLIEKGKSARTISAELVIDIFGQK